MLTWVEINKKRLEHNLHSFREHIGPSVLLMPVVKSNAYGHGMLEVARICDASSFVDRLAVVNNDEAVMLKLAGINKPIQILSFFDKNDDSIIQSIKNEVTFPVYYAGQAIYLDKLATRIGKSVKIHIKIDTGTTRTGIQPDEIENFLSSLSGLKKIVVEGIWSHFASSEADPEFTNFQNKIFEKTCKKAQNNLGKNFCLRHIACSAAAILHKKTHFDAVRVGLGIYGLYPDESCRNKIDLKPILSWKTTIIQIKKIKKGTKISYGGTYTMKNDGYIAVLPVGYYDGYDRDWSNRSFVRIGKDVFPVRGRICMNLSMVEVNSGVKAGDTAELISGTSTPSVDQLTALSKNRINYEVTTRINPVLPRIVV